MIIKNIDHLIKATAALLDIPERVVKHVVNSQFDWLLDEFTTPTKGMILVHNLGKFYIPKKAIYYRVQSLIRKMRENPPGTPQWNPKWEEQLNKLLDVRHEVREYHLSRNSPNNSRTYLIPSYKKQQHNSPNNDGTTDAPSS